MTMLQDFRDAVNQCPDRRALRFVGGDDYSFADLASLTEEWVAVLAEQGVDKGVRVATLVSPSVDAVGLWLALGRLGGVEAPLNPELAAEVLASVVADIAPSLIVADARLRALAQELANKCPSVPAIIAVIAGAGNVQTRLQLTAGASGSVACADEAASLPAPWDLSMILFSSGTTGPAKGVMVPWGQISACGKVQPMEQSGEEVSIYACSRFFHIAGRASVASAIMGRHTLVWRERFSGSHFWSDVRAMNCTHAGMMAAALQHLGRVSRSQDYVDSPLRFISTGSVPEEFLPIGRELGIRFATVFNMTELSCPIASEGWLTAPGGCGRVRAGYECMIVDENDAPLADNHVGELVVRNRWPHVMMQGYWRRPEQTLAAWRNLWFHTGDLFSRDEEGRYFFVGRVDDRIRRRGENISPELIEHAALAVDGVAEAAAYGVRMGSSDEEVALAVVVRSGETLDVSLLVEVLSARLPRFMTPRFIRILDALPLTATGKVRRSELRRQGADIGAIDVTTLAGEPGPR